LVRTMGRRVLEKSGYGCVDAGSIDAAIEVLRTTTVVAAIVDVRLGTESGLDMLPAFRELEEFRTRPILIMTGGVLTAEEKTAVTKHRAFLFYKPEGFTAIINFLD